MAEPGKIVAAADGRYELVITRRYDRPRDEVWKVLTEPEGLAAWLAPVTYEPTAGSPIAITFDVNQVVRGEIVEFSPPRVFAFTWRETDKGPKDSTVRFELREEADSTVLVLTHSRQSAAMARGTAGGWHAQLDLLDGVLRGQPLRWQDVYPPAKALYASVVEEIR